MAPYNQIFQRDDGSAALGAGGVSPIAIAGFCLVGVVLFGLALWAVVYVYRKRQRNKREKAQGAAFLTVKGVVKDTTGEKSPLPR